MQVSDSCEEPASVSEVEVPVLMKPHIMDELHTLDLTTQQVR